LKGFHRIEIELEETIRFFEELGERYTYVIDERVKLRRDDLGECDLEIGKGRGRGSVESFTGRRKGQEEIVMFPPTS